MKRKLEFKIVFILTGLMVIASMAFPARIGKLEGIFKPQMIKVFDNELFVVEAHRIFIYSLKDLSLKKIVGKEGEGPGELKSRPSRTIIITVFPDQILAETGYKLVWFLRDGQFVKERKKVPGILQVLPLGENLVVYKILYGPEGKNSFALYLYDSDMKEIKELHRQKFFTYQQKVFVMPDPLSYSVCDNQLYIDKSPDGFLIDVYDSKGTRVRQIKRDYEKVSVTPERRQAAYTDYIGIPYYRRMKREKGESYFINFLKTLNLSYPDFFPAIQDITVDCGRHRLYVKTYFKKGDNEEYLVMDLEGKLLKKVYLPEALKVDFLVQMQGDKKFYSIHKGKLYYLKNIETEDDEDWEVHEENIE